MTDPQYSKTAQSAYNEQPKKPNGAVLGSTAKFVCPYNDCRTYALQYWGNLFDVTVTYSTYSQPRDMGKCAPITVSKCTACSREAIYIQGQIVMPGESDAPMHATDLPEDLRDDYDEARAILP